MAIDLIELQKRTDKAIQDYEQLPKCKCDKFFTSKGYHTNGCKYAIEFNKLINNL